MLRKSAWVLFAISCISIGLYPVIYFVMDRNFGLLRTKPDAVLSSVVWNTAFYTHIILGGLALLIGWIQFSNKIRTRQPRTHRQIGKVYVLSVLLSGVAGLYIGYFASGGIVPVIGFISLGVFWLYATLRAYTTIRKGLVEQHRKLMIYSYAACFAAVTLRIWLPVLLSLYPFRIAYPIVAWLAWVPNVLVAALIIHRTRKTNFITA